MTVDERFAVLLEHVAWTSWFRTIAGLRADYFDFDVDSDNPENSGKAHDAIVSPKLSLDLRAVARTPSTSSTADSGFHSNDARGTTITVDPKTGEPAERVDPLVRRSATRRACGAESCPA